MTHVQKTHTSKGVRFVSGDICLWDTLTHSHTHTHTHTLLVLLCSLCTRPVLYSRRYQDIPPLLPGKASGYLNALGPSLSLSVDICLPRILSNSSGPSLSLAVCLSLCLDAGQRGWLRVARGVTTSSVARREYTALTTWAESCRSLPFGSVPSGSLPVRSSHLISSPLVSGGAHPTIHLRSGARGQQNASSHRGRKQAGLLIRAGATRTSSEGRRAAASHVHIARLFCVLL